MAGEATPPEPGQESPGEPGEDAVDDPAPEAASDSASDTASPTPPDAGTPEAGEQATQPSQPEDEDEQEDEVFDEPRYCPLCGDGPFKALSGLHGHIQRSHDRQGESKEVLAQTGAEDASTPAALGSAQGGGGSPEDEDAEQGIRPPRVAFREKALAKLTDDLPEVYGISKKRAGAILKTLHDNPSLVEDPEAMFEHIKYMAGDDLNEYHLGLTIRGIYDSIGGPPESREWNMSIPGGGGSQGGGVSFSFPGGGSSGQRGGSGGGSPFDFLNRGGDGPDDPMKFEYMMDMQDRRAQREERMEQLRQEHEARMAKIQKELTEGGDDDSGQETTTIVVDGQQMEVPKDQAPLYLMMKQQHQENEEMKKLRQEVREAKQDALEKEIQHLRQEIEEKPNAWEQIQSVQQMAEHLGYTKGGRSTLDLIETGMKSADTRMAQLIQGGGLMGATPGGEQDYNPQQERSPDQRRQTGEKIEREIDRSQEVKEAEDDLLNTYREKAQGEQG